MLITCLRHATAEPHSLDKLDAERALIKKGKDQMARVAEFCKRNALLPERLYCSPLVRTKQTAQLLAEALHDCPSLCEVEWLVSGAEPQEIIEELTILQASGVSDVWLVGHEPDISMLVSYLLGAEQDCIVIKKASLTRLDVDLMSGADPSAQLLWSVPCALMR